MIIRKIEKHLTKHPRNFPSIRLLNTINELIVTYLCTPCAICIRHSDEQNRFERCLFPTRVWYRSFSSHVKRVGNYHSERPEHGGRKSRFPSDGRQHSWISYSNEFIWTEHACTCTCACACMRVFVYVRSCVFVCTCIYDSHHQFYTYSCRPEHLHSPFSLHMGSGALHVLIKQKYDTQHGTEGLFQTRMMIQLGHYIRVEKAPFHP